MLELLKVIVSSNGQIQRGYMEGRIKECQSSESVPKIFLEF